MGDPNLRQLLRGKGAHVDPVASLADVPASVAGKTVAGYPHSIWQIVEHMNYWMDYELRRIAGERPTYPEHAIESWPQNATPATDDQWRSARERMAGLLQRMGVLADSSTEALAANVVAGTAAEAAQPSTVQDVLWQTLVHNSYHAGQIALLLRRFHQWPPKSGSDSW
jgi:uncharacterized damage-inducible protein DinB